MQSTTGAAMHAGKLARSPACAGGRSVAMNWTAIVQAQRNRSLIGITVLAITTLLLAYAPGTVWQNAAWILFGASATVVVAVVGQMLYAIVSVERGYRSNTPVGTQTSAQAQPRLIP